MKGKKIKTTLLIAIFILSTLAGLAVPVSIASTSITAQYMLKADTASSSVWVADEHYSGSFSVELSVWDGSDPALFAEIVIEPLEINLGTLDLEETSFWAMSSAGDYIPYFIFEVPGTFESDGVLLRISNDADEAASYSSWTKYLASDEVNWQWEIYTAEWVLVDSDWVTWAEIVTLYGDETITCVVVENSAVGIDPILTEAHIDDITINGVAYNLEPQSLTVGNSYTLSWTTDPLMSVTLEYDPEADPTVDIYEEADTSSEGVVNFYNVIPHYAYNWTLSDLTGPPPSAPSGELDETNLVKLDWSYDGVDAAVYFMVQPVEDLDVAVSPSAFDVESGTTALTVTVTSDGEPVGDAYVSVEFWDEEATHLFTDDTALLRSYTIKTASNGLAIFDVAVPEVAGTIFVMAGTDLGPEEEADIDGEYFEHRDC